MTGLRQKMTQDLQLRGLSERTQQAYLRAVRKLAEFYRHSPEWMSLINIRIETQKTLPDVLAPEQVRELLAAVKTPHTSRSFPGQHHRCCRVSRPLNRVLSSHSKTSAPAVRARPAFRLGFEVHFSIRKPPTSEESMPSRLAINATPPLWR